MTPRASLLQPSDDIDIDVTTAPDEWAFFPAPASRMSRRGRLKLIKAERDTDRALADSDRTNVADDEPPVEEPVAAVAVPEVRSAPARSAPTAPSAPHRSADDTMSAADEIDADEPTADVIDIDEPTADEELASHSASLTFESIADNGPATSEEESICGDEPTREAEPTDAYEPASLAEITQLIETEDVIASSVVDEPSTESASDHIAEPTVIKPSPRKRAPRKPTAHKPTAHKPAAPRPAAPKTSSSRPGAAKRSKPAATSETEPLEPAKPGRAPRRPKTEPVHVESDTPAPTVDAEDRRARKRTAKRDFVAAMVLVVIAVAVVGFFVVRDGTPGAPRPSAVDVVSQYARGSEGVIDGAELGFRAEFPGSPERDSAQLRGPDENTTVRYEWLSFRSGDVEFNAGRIAYPDSVDVSDSSALLRKAADGSARAQDGKVESYKELTVNGDRAAESVVSTSDGSYLHTHAVLHGQTLYLVRVESNRQTQPGFDRFADSFEVLA